MNVSEDVVSALANFHRVSIAMPEHDGLSEGRDLVVQLQLACPFPLCYAQRLGCNPVVIVWRMRDVAHAMEGFRVERYHC